MHKITLILLYSVTIISVFFIISIGTDYYILTATDRPHHPEHLSIKPGGELSHGLGVIGGLMMVILLLYSARKRLGFMKRWGDIRFWLNYHIWLGITGPLLVIFHTTFKIGGIIAVSFWSMIAVALSGVLGRYIYIQIPRKINGEEMSAGEMREAEIELLERLQSKDILDKEMKETIGENTNKSEKSNKSWILLILDWFKSDVKIRKLIRELKKHRLARKEMNVEGVKELMSLVRRLHLLRRRIAFLNSAKKILHYWHVIHKPFAIVMLVIMFVHIAVAVLFGYKWVF